MTTNQATTTDDEIAVVAERLRNELRDQLEAGVNDEDPVAVELAGLADDIERAFRRLDGITPYFGCTEMPLPPGQTLDD